MRRVTGAGIRPWIAARLPAAALALLAVAGLLAGWTSTGLRARWLACPAAGSTSASRYTENLAAMAIQSGAPSNGLHDTLPDDLRDALAGRPAAPFTGTAGAPPGDGHATGWRAPSALYRPPELGDEQDPLWWWSARRGAKGRPVVSRHGVGSFAPRHVRPGASAAATAASTPDGPYAASQDAETAGREREAARPAAAAPRRQRAKGRPPRAGGRDGARDAGRQGHGAAPAPDAQRPGLNVRLAKQPPWRGFALGKRRTPKRPPRPPRFRPILLSQLLGKNAIRPPATALAAPKIDFSKLMIPERDARGAPIAPAPPPPEDLESYAPPASQGRHSTRAHWDAAPDAAWLHQGAARGRWDGTHWAWLAREDGRWWLQAPPQSEAKEPVAALVRHGEHWWWRAKGAWFLLHDGKPWGYRFFEDLEEEGLINPETGARMIYSADGLRVALVVPGGGAVLYDALTGAVLGRWSEEQMPKPRRPRAPPELPNLP